MSHCKPCLNELKSGNDKGETDQMIVSNIETEEHRADVLREVNCTVEKFLLRSETTEHNTIECDNDRELDQKKETTCERINLVLFIEFKSLLTLHRLVGSVLFTDFLQFWLNSLHCNLTFDHFCGKWQQNNLYQEGKGDNSQSSITCKEDNEEDKKIIKWLVEYCVPKGF